MLLWIPTSTIPKRMEQRVSGGQKKDRPRGGAALIMQLYGIAQRDAIKLDQHLYWEVYWALKEGREISFDIDKIVQLLTGTVPSDKLHTTLNSILDLRGRVIEHIVSIAVMALAHR